MIKILLFVAMVIIISIGYGIEFNNKLKLNILQFSGPIGFTIFLFLNQLFYYPIQLFNLSFNYIILITTLTLILGLYFAIKNITEIKNQIFNKKMLIILFTTLIFLFVFYNLTLDLDYSDGTMYLNYIAQNINIDHLNLFNLYTGLLGQEWDGLYLYQGYYHFGSYMCWAINIPHYLFNSSTYVANIAISSYGLGLLYSVISNMIFINIIEYLNIEDKLIKYSTMFFILFFSNYYYWRVAFAYYGNTFRTLLITMLIFYIFMWFRSKNDNLKYAFIPILGAGLACSSSFLFISFTVIFCLMVYLFLIKKEHAFVDLSIIVTPILLYAVIFINIATPKYALILLILALIYYLGLIFNYVNPLIKIIENFLFKYARIIFYIILPVLAAMVSWYINKYIPEFPYNYSYYFQNHSYYDMVKSYDFRDVTTLDIITNVFRWLGIIIIFIKANTTETRWVKEMMLLSLILFLNPLTTTVIAYTIASNVFYRIIEVLFNPFTEILILIYLFDFLKSKKILQIIFSLAIILVTLSNHYYSWSGSGKGSYVRYINPLEDILPIFKVTGSEYDVITNFELELEKVELPTDRQLTVISQTNGLRTFMPNVYQLFTARDTYYAHTRIDKDFYELARRLRDWEPEQFFPYENSCGYIDKYNVDYLLIRYWENPAFDQATDGCTVTIYTSDTFKIKKVEK